MRFLMFIVFTMIFHLPYYPVFFLSEFLTESIVAITIFFVGSVPSELMFLLQCLICCILQSSFYLNFWETIVAMTKWLFVASIFSVVIFIITFLPLLSLVLLYRNLWDQIFFTTMIHLDQFLCLCQILSAIIFFSFPQVSFTFSNLPLIWNRTLYLLMYKNMFSFQFSTHSQWFLSEF